MSLFPQWSWGGELEAQVKARKTFGEGTLRGSLKSWRQQQATGEVLMEVSKNQARILIAPLLSGQEEEREEVNLEGLFQPLKEKFRLIFLKWIISCGRLIFKRF